MRKRGDRYVRTPLIHGACAVLRHATQKTEARSRWLPALMHRRGRNVAVVAVAPKNARILRALVTREEDCRKAVCLRDRRTTDGGGPAPHGPEGSPTSNRDPADDGEEGFTPMARQVRPALSQPGPHTGPRGPISEEANERACQQGHRSEASDQEAGSMRAVVMLSCQQPRNPLQTGWVHICVAQPRWFCTCTRK